MNLAIVARPGGSTWLNGVMKEARRLRAFTLRLDFRRGFAKIHDAMRRHLRPSARLHGVVTASLVVFARLSPIHAAQPMPPTSAPMPRPLALAPVAHDHVVLGAFVDTAYAFNPRRPANHLNRGSYTAPRTNEFNVNLAVLYLRHDPKPSAPWTAELALQVGAAADALLADDPTPGGNEARFAGAEVWKHLGRANAGVKLFSTATELAAGLFTTPIGYFSFWSKDNWTYSTPWHLNGVPYVLLGARVIQPITPYVETQLWLVNGWQSYADLNESPSAMVAVFIKPLPGLSIGELLYIGPEGPSNRLTTYRTFSDFQIVYVGSHWRTAAIWDYGQERTPWLTRQHAKWASAAIVGQVSAWRRRHMWDLAARAELYWDGYGRLYGVPQTIVAGTLTSDLRLFQALLLRLEYRYDHSNAKGGYFFGRKDAATGSIRRHAQQHLVYAGLTFYFETALRLPRSNARND